MQPSYLISLPKDVYLKSIFLYVEPSQLDKYCLINDEIHQWCRNPENIEVYLRLRGYPRLMINISIGLFWAAEVGSQMLVNYFISRGATQYNLTAAIAAKHGHQTILDQMLNLIIDKGLNVRYEYILTQAAAGGQLQIIKQIMQLDRKSKRIIGIEDINAAMIQAAKNAHEEVVELMLEFDAYQYPQAMIAAAEGGSLNIVIKMLDKMSHYPTESKIYTYNQTLDTAAKGGYKSIVDLMLTLGANDYVTAMIAAASSGNKTVFDQMLKLARGDDKTPLSMLDYNQVMLAAGANGHLDIMLQMIDLGADDLITTMIAAAVNGYQNIINFLLALAKDREMELTAYHFNFIMNAAAKGGYLNIVEQMLTVGADDYNQSLVSAAERGNIEIVDLMLKLGADSYENSLFNAEEAGYQDVINLIIYFKVEKLSDQQSRIEEMSQIVD